MVLIHPMWFNRNNGPSLSKKRAINKKGWLQLEFYWWRYSLVNKIETLTHGFEHNDFNKPIIDIGMLLK